MYYGFFFFPLWIIILYIIDHADQNAPLYLTLQWIFLLDVSLLFCSFNSVWSYFCTILLHALEETMLTQQTYRSPLQDIAFNVNGLWWLCPQSCNEIFKAHSDSFSQWLHGKSLTLWGQCRTVMTAQSCCALEIFSHTSLLLNDWPFPFLYILLGHLLYCLIFQCTNF